MHDASRSQWQEYAHIFPSGTVWEIGDPKRLTRVRGPNLVVIDRSIVVGCRSRNDRQRDKRSGMTIRLTLCERDATDRQMPCSKHKRILHVALNTTEELRVRDMTQHTRWLKIEPPSRKVRFFNDCSFKIK